MPLSAVGNAAFDAVSVADLKSHLRIDDTEQDAYLTDLISVAMAYVEAQVQRRYRRQAFKFTATCWPRHFVLPIAPVDRATVVIKYRNSSLIETTLPVENYGAIEIAGGGARLALKDGYSWPDLGEHAEAVKVEFDAGYATVEDVPAMVKHAIKVYAAQLYHGAEGSVVRNDPSTPNNIAAMLMSEHWFI